MGPVIHTVVSLSIGTAAWVGGASPLAVPVAVAAGVLPDLDHLVDFWDPKDEGRSRYMLRPFHAWEYLLVALILAVGFFSSQLLMVAILGYLSHLAIDQLVNRVHPLAYSLAYRVSKGFRRRALTPHIFEAGFQPMPLTMPWWGRLEPSIWRLVMATRRPRDNSSN